MVNCIFACTCVQTIEKKKNLMIKLECMCVLGRSRTRQLHGCRPSAAFYPFIGLKTRSLSLLFDFTLQPPAFGRSFIVLPHTDTRAISQVYLHTTTLRCHLIISHSKENILSFLLFDWKMKDSVLFLKSNNLEKKERKT